VIIYASEVQGKQAASQLIQAINLANHDKRCQVLILARGGGSMEDLWAFNDEQLAHTIVHSRLPIVSGIGHETDFTIADFVADLRAATPTAAAEAVSPNAPDLIDFFQLQRIIARFIQHQQLLLQHQLQKITSPKQLISSYWQSLDYLTNHLWRAQQQLISVKKHQLNLITEQLKAKHPSLLLEQAGSRLRHLEQQLHQHVLLKMNHLKQQLSTELTTLKAVSPLATLDRGYAIITLNNKVVLNPQEVRKEDIIDVRLSLGHITASVIHTKKQDV
jgi:exodeoxyribonuclease VII large subunit